MNWNDVKIHLSLDGWGDLSIKDAQLCNDKLSELLINNFPGIKIDSGSWELIEYESLNQEKALGVKEFVEENWYKIIQSALGFKES